MDKVDMHAGRGVCRQAFARRERSRRQAAARWVGKRCSQRALPGSSLNRSAGMCWRPDDDG